MTPGGASWDPVTIFLGVLVRGTVPTQPFFLLPLLLLSSQATIWPYLSIQIWFRPVAGCRVRAIPGRRSTSIRRGTSVTAIIKGSLAFAFPLLARVVVAAVAVVVR